MLNEQAKRAICYHYEALSQTCDESNARQTNAFEGSKYFDSKYLLKACASDSRKVSLPGHYGAFLLYSC